jgi:hypothetical protein
MSILKEPSGIVAYEPTEVELRAFKLCETAATKDALDVCCGLCEAYECTGKAGTREFWLKGGL